MTGNCFFDITLTGYATNIGGLTASVLVIHEYWSGEALARRRYSIRSLAWHDSHGKGVKGQDGGFGELHTVWIVDELMLCRGRFDSG